MTAEEKAKLREQLHTLLDIVLDGNDFEERNTRMTGSKPTAFFHLSGHVNELQIVLHPNGWDHGPKWRERREWLFPLNREITTAKIDEIWNAMKEANEKAGAVDAGHNED